VRDTEGHVRPPYGIALECEPTEHRVTTLPGYAGMGPVRVGSQAFEHSQHDVHGSIVLGSSQAFHDHRLFRRDTAV